MVAIRQTHSSDFDFISFIHKLELPAEDKQVIQATVEQILAQIEDKSSKRALQLSRQGKISSAVELYNLNKARFEKLSSEMVAILVNLNMDLMSLQVAVIFPAYEQGFINKAFIEEQYGSELRKLLEKVKDMEAIYFLQNLHHGSVNETQVDRVRRMLLSMVDDVRAVVIKLAERIGVIRLISKQEGADKTLIAREISNIYAPLANRLGIGQLKWELEDLAFKFLHNDEYMAIAKALAQRRVEREQYVNAFVDKLQTLIRKAGIEAQVYGRPKHIYSIWRKMQRKHLDFSQIYDVRAVRVLVQRVPDCYGVLSLVHENFKRLDREFDDYIANPKPNGYQSLHTVIYGEGQRAIEVQIRTQRMHNFAENGVAAHWKYKEGSGQSQGAEQRIAWLRKLLSWRDDLVESGALLEEFKQQVFEDRVYVFTPQGEIVDLPTGSTPLDFAYQVHTMVGHRCIGAKVDGRIVPFTYKLKTGETVEIITQKNPNPSRDWLKIDAGFLKTNKARAKVAAWFRKVDYADNQVAGLEILRRENEQRHWGLSKDTLWSILKDNLNRFNVKTVDDVISGVGSGEITVNSIQNLLHTYFEQQQKTSANNAVTSSELVSEQTEAFNELIKQKTVNALKKRQHNSKNSNYVTVDGVGNILTNMAKCCRPIPGDKIIGFITLGRGISVHRSDCLQFQKLSANAVDRVIGVQWGDFSKANFSVTLRVLSQNNGSIVRDVTTTIANEKIDMTAVRSHTDSHLDRTVVDLDIVIHDVLDLNKIKAAIAQISSVIEVQRL